MDAAEASPRHSRRWLVLLLVAVLLLVVAFEGYRFYAFYTDLTEAKAGLLSIRDKLDLKSLNDSEADIVLVQDQLVQARAHTLSAARFARNDPALTLATWLPFAGKQAKAVKTLALAADESTRTGLDASSVALSFARYQRPPEKTSIEAALDFLKTQDEPMLGVSDGLIRLQAYQASLPAAGLAGPLQRGRVDLDEAVGKLDSLVNGYARASRLLPEVLGYNSTKRYLVLPENDTELFPSGGLISSYGVVTFQNGRLVSMDFEYFGELYDRWQAKGRDYVEPPLQLKNYLKRDYSWALGEAGWYPDFPTTASLARGFVAKGGVAPTDGTIAIDLKFVSALLQALGPVNVPEYNVTVTAENLSEVSLEQTRDEDYVPGTKKKAFLSYLARGVLNQLFATPKENWVNVLRTLDRMGRERHFQLNFQDQGLQDLSTEYGLDGGLVPSGNGDFLLVADTSVNSTKLNMILETSARVEVALGTNGRARSQVTYAVTNPLPEWRKGRDPKVVASLMLSGVYGSYTRLFVREGVTPLDLRLNDKRAGFEQATHELGKSLLGRYFQVEPGQTTTAQFLYETPGVVTRDDRGVFHYRLYVQKQPGTAAMPLEVTLALPPSAGLRSLMLDGQAVKGPSVKTDLSRDRLLDVAFVMP